MLTHCAASVEVDRQLLQMTQTILLPKVKPVAITQTQLETMLSVLMASTVKLLMTALMAHMLARV